MKEERKNYDWIPVTEGLPIQPPDRVDENGQRWTTVDDSYLITDINDKVYEAYYTYSTKEFWWKDSLHPIRVKAWMPMPEAYKEDENTDKATYEVCYISGHSLKYAVREVEADSEEEAVEKVFRAVGENFENRLISVRKKGDGAYVERPKKLSKEV